MKKRNTMDMTQGSIPKLLILFSIPLILNKLLSICYNMTDKIMLGQFIGDNAMAAAGVTNAPFTLFFNLFTGFSMGVLVCCGNHLGARNRKALEECMHAGIVVGALLGVLVTVLGLLLSRPLLVAVGVPEVLMADALVYFNIRFLSTLFLICSAFETNIMIAHGDTRRITLFSGISGFVNVVLNYVFLRVIPLGVAGVALATLLSELLYFVCKTRLLFSANGEYRLRFDRLRLHKDHARQILAIGIPNGLNNTMFTFSNMLLQSTVNSFGPVYITANSCADSVSDIVSLAYTGLPNACLAAVSQCHGARDYPRIRQVIRHGFLIIESLIVILAIVVMIFARQILGLFTSTVAVVDAALPKVFFYITGYMIHTFQQVYMAGLKGLKHSGRSFAINAIGVCVPRVLWVLLVMPVFPNPSILYAIYPISWLIASVPMGIAFHRTYRKLAADNENLKVESGKIS